MVIHMALNLGILNKGKSFSDYQRLEEEFQLKKQLAQAQIMSAQARALASENGGQLPAPLQLANEFQKARAAGDTQRMSDIAQFAKIYDRGVIQSAESGIQPLPGYAASVANIEGAKAGAKQQAEKNVDLRMNPQIKQGESRGSAIGEATGKAEGGIESKYIKAPQIEEYLSQAEKLLPDATSGGFETNRRDIAGYFGSATKGSLNDSRLDVIGAALTSGVPRMEGPQSNYDVALYQQAAGDLANPKKPFEVRQAAIKTIREINNKYINNGGLNSPVGGEVPLSRDTYKSGEADFNAKKVASPEDIAAFKKKHGIK